MSQEFLLKYAEEGRFVQWYSESFSSLSEICEMLEDWVMAGHELLSVIAIEVVEGQTEWRGDKTNEVKEMLKQRDHVRMETEYMNINQPDIGFDLFCELNARF